MANIKIASVAMSAPADKKANMETYLKYIEQAHEQGVKLIVFPELSLPGIHPDFTLSQAKNSAATYYAFAAELVPEGPSTQRLIEAAKAYDMYIVYDLAEQDPVRPDYTYNTAVLVGPEGYVGKHRKIHPTGSERLLFMPGHELNVFDTAIGRIGLLICNDKVFPETVRALKIAGAEIVACCTCWPAMNPQLGDNDPMLKIHSGLGTFRALENTLIFVDANIAGSTDGVHFEVGNSRVVGPMGNDLANTGWDEGMAVAELDVQQTIKGFFASLMGGAISYSSLRDLRPDVYIPFYEHYQR